MLGIVQSRCFFSPAFSSQDHKLQIGPCSCVWVERLYWSSWFVGAGQGHKLSSSHPNPGKLKEQSLEMSWWLAVLTRMLQKVSFFAGTLCVQLAAARQREKSSRSLRDPHNQRNQKHLSFVSKMHLKVPVSLVFHRCFINQSTGYHERTVVLPYYLRAHLKPSLHLASCL